MNNIYKEQQDSTLRHRSQQDFAWKCLSKEIRDKIISTYYCKEISTDDYNIGYSDALKNIYGKRNITSDIEPEEILIKSRAKVIDLYAKAKNEMSFGSEDLQLWGKYCIEILDSLYGNKCLPDKEDDTNTLKPKFKVGDKVIHKQSSHIWRTITAKKSDNTYILDYEIYDVKESDLKLYIESKTKNNMKEKELNLCKILKGHEGETFYNAIAGINIKLKSTNNGIVFNGVSFNEDGSYVKGGECMLFPSKDQRDWEIWDKENNHKTPKTWSELIKDNEILLMGRATSDPMYSETDSGSAIEKSASALLKIHQIIEAGYGGNVTNEDIQNNKFAIIKYDFSNKKFIVQGFPGFNLKLGLIYFKNIDLAKEFTSYPENVQLLKDYFMI